MNIITREMISNGYYHGLVQLTRNDAEETVCQIGEHWFFFGYDKCVSDMNLFDYCSNNTLITIIDDIYQALEDIREDIENGNTEMEDEYNYYYWYLVENIH